jgi:hypothetical protein
MSWGTCHRGCITFLLLTGLIQGCSGHQTHGISDLPRSNALFAADRSSSLATQFGRSAWPATDGAIESPQETVFQEFYYDFQSDSELERFYPYRTFTSYRTGVTQR